MSRMLRKELKMLLPYMLLLDALVYGISLCFTGFQLSMLWGLLLGSAAEILNLILLERAVRAALRKSPGQAKVSMGISYAGRSLMAAGVIAFAYVCRQTVNPIGTALPFLFPKLIYFIRSIVSKGKER